MMRDVMIGGMMRGIGAISVLTVVVLLLLSAAPVKYLFR